MKKVLLYILFLFISATSFAQIDTTTQVANEAKMSQDTLVLVDSFTYIAGSKAIITKDTLNFQQEQSQSKTISNPNDDLTFPGNDSNTQNINSQLDAGRTSSVIDISPTGAATYTVPISLPKGIGGVNPQIALSYNSQGGNGVAGFGWNVGGLSSITRIPPTRFHDNKIGGVNFDADDRFALDGQRLILKNGIYGADGAEYQTESFSNLKIISHGVSSYGANYGPEYFEVISADGTKAFYGFSTDSRTQINYAITYSENVLGIRINYFYSKNIDGLNRPTRNTFQVISKITYGSTGANTPLNQIDFLYKDPTRKDGYYISNQDFFNDKLLSQINVVANGINFRSYILEHDIIPSLKYERLLKITELNGDNTKAFAPIIFSYESQMSDVINTNASNMGFTGLSSDNSEIITGDFTGNGSIDFILYPKTSKNKIYPFWDPETNSQNQYVQQISTGYFEDIFPVSWLNYSNKLMPSQAFVLVKYVDDATIKFETYSAGTTSPVYYQYEKQWDNVQSNGYSNCNGDYVDEGKIPRKFISGDFNGDGLTDVVSITKPYQQYFDYEDPNCDGIPQQNKSNNLIIDPNPGHCCVTSSYTVNSASVQFINLDRRETSNFITYSGSLNVPIGVNDKILAADFNGDGKSDILHITEGNMYVYSFDDNNYLSSLWQTTDTRIKLQYAQLIGDFNGDGKMDLLFPTSFDNTNHLYVAFLSSGVNFKKFEQNYPFGNPAYFDNGHGHLNAQNFIANDVNGDGKADLIYYNSDTDNGATYGYLIVSVFHNIGSANIDAAPTFENGGYKSFALNLIHHPIPIFLTSNIPNFKQEFGIISDASLNLFNFRKDIKTEGLINAISQDGVTNQIFYKPLIADNNSNDELQIYKESYDQTFPNIDIHSALGLKVVSKLQRTFIGTQISQVFGYEGATSNAEGLGFLGLKKTIRSNWFADDDNNRIYNINITDPLLRGATTKSFTTKYPYLSSSVENTASIKPDVIRTDPSLSQETVIASHSVTLKPGFTANGTNGFIAKISDPATGVNDAATINDYITRTDYTYDTSISPEKIFTNVPTSVMTKDLLNGTNTTLAYTYDNYNNVTKETTNLSGAGTNTTEITYDNNLGSTYYIGRPLTKKTTATNVNDVFTTEEEYTYTGFLPTQIKRKGNGTDWVIENVQYDTFGNTTRKGLTAGGVERASTMQYDPTGRFMTKSTDLEGLETNFTYDNSTGSLLNQTDPYGLTSTFQYDTWGRLIQSTDFLGFNNYTSYEIYGGGSIKISTYNDEGNSEYNVTSAIGNKILQSNKTVTGSQTYKSLIYDAYGRLKNESEPYNVFATQYTETTYDDYGRVSQIQNFTGKTTNITYNGLSVTVNDGTKSVSTTKNALGNTTSVTDPGGTINYTYYANGNLKTSNFDSNEQAIIQDGWGRKTQLTDPSAGVYTYTYNAFGESLTESTPKGVTTFVYDAIGKLQSKTVVGDATNMVYQYTYDGTSKLLTAMTLANTDGNNANYIYTYDTYKRLQSSVENNTYATFTKSFTFDGFGRISTETSIALNKSNNKTVTKTLLNTYQYGALNSISDNATGEVIWMVNSVNSRGQVTMASLANGNMRQTNTYDQYGFATEMKTDRLINNPALLMSLGYNFNTQRGNLNSRTNSVFNWSEIFTHDSQDRLTAFNDNNGNNSQVYDNKGRISTNSFLGNYVYNGGSYQQIGLNNVTVDAQRHYQDRIRQDITYNAFKSPVEISEAGKEKISFQYNASMGRAHRYYGDENADKMQRRFRKHYSEDGSMEITEDIQLGTTSFVFYMGGDAYSAPAIWKEISDASNQVTQNMYYLHRDHLGSILLITDNQGVIKEQRQFDAWGNIVKLQDGNGTALTDFLIIDRGYTGHEHLLAVGLIHMNGRLYDPKLHRFLQPDNYIQDPYNSQNYNRYAYVLNNPLTHIDPSGEIIPLLVVAAIVGGGANVWSNWDKIVKNPWSAVSYFASGAIGGAVSVANPWLGGAITGFGNIAVDAAYGNIPKFKGIGDVAKYAGGKALQGLGAAGAGGISKFGYNLASKLGWVQTGAFNGSTFLLGSGTEGIASSVTAPEFILNNTKTALLEPLLETGADLGKSAVQGSKYLKFTGDQAIEHFGKHAEQIMKVTGESAYNLKNYVHDANWVIKNGTYSSKLNGYYSFIGNSSKGESLFGFTGLKNGGSNITTFYIKTATSLGLK